MFSRIVEPAFYAQERTSLQCKESTLNIDNTKCLRPVVRVYTNVQFENVTSPLPTKGYRIDILLGGLLYHDTEPRFLQSH